MSIYYTPHYTQHVTYFSAPGFTAWWLSAASLSRSVSINNSSGLLATGLRCQQGSFIGSSIINEESKAPDDRDYPLGTDGQIPAVLQLCSTSSKYDRTMNCNEPGWRLCWHLLASALTTATALDCVVVVLCLRQHVLWLLNTMSAISWCGLRRLAPLPFSQLKLLN